MLNKNIMLFYKGLKAKDYTKRLLKDLKKPKPQQRKLITFSPAPFSQKNIHSKHYLLFSYYCANIFLMITFFAKKNTFQIPFQ